MCLSHPREPGSSQGRRAPQGALSAGGCVPGSPSCSHLCPVLLREKLGVFCEATGTLLCSAVERAEALESVLVILALSFIEVDLGQVT